MSDYTALNEGRWIIGMYLLASFSHALHCLDLNGGFTFTEFFQLLK